MHTDGVGATSIVMEHHGHPIGAAIAGTDIDLEGGGEVLTHIDAPVDIAVPAWFTADVKVYTPSATSHSHAASTQRRWAPR